MISRDLKPTSIYYIAGFFIISTLHLTNTDFDIFVSLLLKYHTATEVSYNSLLLDAPSTGLKLKHFTDDDDNDSKRTNYKTIYN